MFSERSTFEVQWFTVRPRAGWINKAEALTSADHDGRGAVGAGAIAPRVEIGDFHDNASVLAVANWKINSGAVKEGLAMLNVLRSHITGIDDQKSRKILLPVIEEVIGREGRKEMEKQSVADSTGAERRTASAAAAPATGSGRKCDSQANDLVTQFKLHLIDVVGLVTALCWTHNLLVREITTLPSLAASPIWANGIAGFVLAIMLRLVSGGGSL